jgi:hypothetical protein
MAREVGSGMTPEEADIVSVDGPKAGVGLAELSAQAMHERVEYRFGFLFFFRL